MNCSLYESSYEALQSLFVSTGGPGWYLPQAAVPWHFPSTLSAPCEDGWFGITCELFSNGICDVKKFQLASIKMQGTLPENLSNLAMLGYLDFGSNSLVGSLPSAWSSLESLTVLAIDNNSLEGSLPKAWETMKSLTNINLQGNQLVGSLTSHWSSLRNLSIINLSDNKLTNTFPNKWDALTKLQYLSLNQNSFSGCLQERWSNMALLKLMDFSANNLNCTLPNWITNFKFLQNLYLNNNSFSGTIPTSWGNFNNVSEINISFNMIRGILPQELSSIGSDNESTLSSIIFHGNLLQGNIPTIWSRMNVLKTLDLGQNILFGSLPEWIFNSSSLATLDLSNNNFNGMLFDQVEESSIIDITLTNNSITGQLPNSWSKMQCLSKLTLTSNRISGPLPSDWSTLANLTMLDISMNSICGKLPEQWSSMVRLSHIALKNNALSGTLPVVWANLSSLSKLDIPKNSINGSLPIEWANIRTLEVLDVASNSLTGSLPVHWSSIENLSKLLLGGNQLIGSLPQEWSSLSKMIYLNTSRNYIEGHLPVSYSTWINVHQIYLYSNSHSGSLPLEWSTMQVLYAFEIDDNHVTGSLPTEWSTMIDLQKLIVCGNQIESSFPSSWSTLTELLYLDVAENQLTGTIPMSWSTWSNILYLNASTNNLEGTFPPLAITTLKILDLKENNLGGSLPTIISTYQQLVYLHLDSNEFIGQLPQIYSVLTKLMDFGVPNNDLDGSIPFAYTSLEKLIAFDIAGNHFEGRINMPYGLKYAFCQMNRFTGSNPIPTTIIYLNISRNHFDGNMFKELYWPQANPSLTTLDISYNKFSGNFDPERLSSIAPGLQVLVISKNCFTGTISNYVCSWKNMTAFVADMIGKRRHCENKYVFTFPISGSIPTCLFVLPNLSVVQLTGNNLHGILPDLSPSSVIRQVGLEANYLTGTLPNSWQMHDKWEQIELKINKLSGTLTSNFTRSPRKITMSSNRISGNIPKSFVEIPTLDILNGNIFSCASVNNANSDNSYMTYICGLRSLDYVFYCYVTGLGVAILILMFSRCEKDIYDLLVDYKPTPLMMTITYTWLGVAMTLIAFQITVKNMDSFEIFEYYNDYHWSYYTVANINGYIPLVIPIVVFVATIFMSIAIQNEDHHASTYLSPHKIRNQYYWKTKFYQFINLMVSSGVTVVLVLSDYFTKSNLHTSLNFIVAIFRVLWSAVFVDWMIRQIASTSFTNTFLTYFTADMISFVLSPLITVIFSDRQCLNDLFQKLTKVSVTFDITVPSFYLPNIYATKVKSFQEKVLQSSLQNVTISMRTAVTEDFYRIRPEWEYTSQCSSSIITTLIPVLLYMYAVYVLLVPIITTFILIGLKRIEREKYGKRYFMHILLPLSFCNESITNPRRFEETVAVDSIRNTARIHSQFLRHLVILLIFGATMPLFIFVVIICMFLEDMIIHAQLSVLVEDMEDTGLYTQADMTRISDMVFNKRIPNVHKRYLPLMMLATPLYWAFYAFDVVSDKYYFMAGTIAAVVYTSVEIATVIALNFESFLSIYEALPRVNRPMSLGLELQELFDKRLRTLSSSRRSTVWWIRGRANNSK